MATYYWDFYGPRGAGTAAHFAAHLEQFLAQHQLAGCTVGHSSPTDNHSCAWCVAPAAAHATIEAALRPRRKQATDPSASLGQSAS